MGLKFGARQSFYKLDRDPCFMTSWYRLNRLRPDSQNSGISASEFCSFSSLATFPFKCLSLSFKSILTIKHPFKFSGPYSEIRSAK